MFKTHKRVKYMNMKKLIIAIFIFIFLLSGQKANNFSLLNYFDGEYSAYTSSKEYGGTNLGICYMTQSKKVKDKIGESLIIKNFEAGAAIKTLQAKIVKTEYLPTGATVIYAYSNLIPKSIKQNSKDVNLQIACYDDYVVIGWPVIIGSF